MDIRKYIMIGFVILLMIPHPFVVFADTSNTEQTADELVIHYAFEGHLADEKDENIGSETGNKLDQEGGQITFEEGIKGQAAKFDGESGIRLPNGIISSDQYSVSLWLKPEEITQ